MMKVLSAIINCSSLFLRNFLYFCIALIAQKKQWRQRIEEKIIWSSKYLFKEAVDRAEREKPIQKFGYEEV